MGTCCECCGDIFIPLPTVKDQRYCGKPVCQKARKNLWQKRKLASDRDYRENQADCRKAWSEKHPGYWKEYRANHSSYVKRNREKQRERNRGRSRKGETDPSTVVVKMDESTPRKIIPSGRYRMVPVCNQVIAKMDEWIVEIGVVSTGSACVSPGP
jgi:hypothetical protein